jgi:hypothetical protein
MNQQLASLPDQTCTTLHPADHVRVLHPLDRRGIVTVARGGDHWCEVAVPIADLATYVADHKGQTDVFLSQQSFWGWRRIAQLAQIGAAYVDLDYHRTERWAGTSAEWVTEAVLKTLDENRTPGPSYVLSTGRGLLVIWLHDLVPRAALPRWMALQRTLAGILAPFGADLRALDAARVFRLSGTRNSKAEAIVRPTFMAASPAELWRWNFEDLANEVLPVERAELVALRSRRAQQRARGEGPPPAHKLTVATYWETVLTDLQKLIRFRWFGVLPPGQRDCWLFVAGCAMSWLAPPPVMRRELNALAQEVGGWSEREAANRMSSVFRRAEMAARGVRADWNGKQVDPRYRLKAATIVEWLQITPAEMRSADLRVLIDQDARRERAAERQEAHRRRQGVQERAAFLATSVEAQAPWKAEGISRATWQRRRKKECETGVSRCMVA